MKDNWYVINLKNAVHAGIKAQPAEHACPICKKDQKAKEVVLNQTDLSSIVYLLTVLNVFTTHYCLYNSKIHECVALTLTGNVTLRTCTLRGNEILGRGEPFVTVSHDCQFWATSVQEVYRLYKRSLQRGFLTSENFT